VLLLTPQFALVSRVWKQASSNWNFIQCAEQSQFAVIFFRYR